AYVQTHPEARVGPFVCLRVSDTGCGMDAATLGRIFEPFFTTKDVGKGTGLGLATVYGIVKQHNGYITVYSEPRQGTIFRVYLPLVDADDPTVRKLTAEILRTHGYTIMEAQDGEEAVMVFMENRNRVDLIVMDVVMPKKNGEEAYEEIKEIDRDAKVIFVSGYTGDVVLDKGLGGETIDFISKPLSPTALLKMVRKVLDRQT